MTLSTLWSWPALLITLAVLVLLRHRRKDDDSNIPWATGAIPLLGHALAYKRDPASFITEQRKLVGDVFRLNLAGKRMIVVAGGAENVKAVAFASERRFSARAAVRDVGFGELLGERNVDTGTDFHARVLRRPALGQGNVLLAGVLSTSVAWRFAGGCGQGPRFAQTAAGPRRSESRAARMQGA